MVDPDRGVELLWRQHEQEPRQGLSVGRIVRAAVQLADAEGLQGLSMRKIAERLGFTTMSLYRHVPGRDQLVDLMLDAVYGELRPSCAPSSEPPPGTPSPGGPENGMEPSEWRGACTKPDDGSRDDGGRDATADGATTVARPGWRGQLEVYARDGWKLRRRHLWVAEVRGSRHLPGPNVLACYDRALAMVADTPLTPAQQIAAVDLVGRFVDAEALLLVEKAQLERQSEVSDDDWWGARDALWERLDRYPAITGLWEAGGFHHPEDPFEFGLARVLDGIEALIKRSRYKTRDESCCPVCGQPVECPASGRPRRYCSPACRQRAYRARARQG
jgi:AcrR family transcriptional regulator